MGSGDFMAQNKLHCFTEEVPFSKKNQKMVGLTLLQQSIVLLLQKSSFSPCYYVQERVKSVLRRWIFQF